MKQLNICEELGQNFIDASYEMNSCRAFADARDGLKPGQRACLWEMFTKGYTTKKAHVKSAKIAGGVVGTWWPHGDTAIYDTFTRMSQSWINNIPEVDWHGNNGSQIIPDAWAASRYTEARLSKIVEETMFSGIKKNNVNMILNYSEDEEWPEVLPAIFPRLMVNGCQGIGSTIANVWLPHSLSDICNVISNYLTTGELDYSNLYPDFPSGGQIINKNDIHTIYETGKGKAILRARAEIKGKHIYFRELPYQVYVEPLIEKIKNLVIKEELDNIESIHNRSNKNGLEIDIECSIDPVKVLPELYAKTDLQKSYSANQWALVGKTPKLLTLQEYIDIYLKHNDECIYRETEFDKKKAEDRLHIVEGLVVAVASIDKIISLIRNAEDRGAAAKSLALDFPTLSEIQIKAILDMRLASLTKLDGVKLEDEKKELTNKIIEFNEILSSQEKRNNILIDKILDMKKKYGDERRTKLENIDIVKEKKAIPAEDCIVTLYEDGTLKRSKKEVRKGKNITASTPIKTIKANTIDEVFIFTDSGKVYKEEISNIPEDKRLAAKNICESIGKEKPIYILIPEKDDENKSVCFFTKNGMYKKTMLSEYVSLKRAKKGAVAIKLKPEDELREILILDENDSVILATDKGFSLRLSNSNINPIGRACAGVIGIKLNDGDELVTVSKVEKQLGVISKDGKIKKISIQRVPLQTRGTKGKVISEKGISKIIALNDNDTVCVYGIKERNVLKSSELTDRPQYCLKNDVIKDVLVLD